MTLNLKETNMLRFNTNTLQEVRKELGLDQQGIERDVDILQEWAQKQEHFVKKNFEREYLERIILSTKGSVEKAKVRVDKICTLRTLAPELFAITNVKNLITSKDTFKIVSIPVLTEENYRIYISQLKGDLTTSNHFEAYQFSIVYGHEFMTHFKKNMLEVVNAIRDVKSFVTFRRLNLIVVECQIDFGPKGSEYMMRNDYSNGAYVILDVMNTSVMNLVSTTNINDLRNVTTAYMDGFGIRIKGIYLLSTSKLVDTLVSLLKQVLSAKLFGRMHVIKSVDDLVQHLPKKLLPEDYGGDQKSISELFDMWKEEISSEDHVKYMEEMRGACTNESLRRSDDKRNDDLGMPGTFKTLTVD